MQRSYSVDSEGGRAGGWAVMGVICKGIESSRSGHDDMGAVSDAGRTDHSSG